MPNELEFTFLSIGDTLETNAGVMTKAVRVKHNVAEKVQRVSSKFSLSAPLSKKDNKKEEKLAKNEVLIDESKENLDRLNKCINEMHLQKNVPVQTKRVVLFTNNLKDKASSMGNKFIKIESKKTIPNNWDNIDMNIINDFESKKLAEPKLILEKEVKEEVKPVNNRVEEPKVIPEVKIEEPKVLEKKEEPKVVEKKEEKNTIEFKKIDEPSSLPNVKVEIDDKVKSMPVEDKINELLNIKTETKDKKEEKPVEEKKEIKKENEKNDGLSSKALEAEIEKSESLVKSRFYKVKKTLTDVQTENLSLKAENATLEEKNKTISKNLEDEKNRGDGYLITIKELTSKNNDLEKANNKLTAEKENADKNYKEKIDILNGNVNYYKTVALKRETEKEALKKEFKKELEESNKIHKEELQRAVNQIRAEKNAEIKEIYSSFADALSDLSLDEVDEKGKTA